MRHPLTAIFHPAHAQPRRPRWKRNGTPGSACVPGDGDGGGKHSFSAVTSCYRAGTVVTSSSSVRTPVVHPTGLQAWPSSTAALISHHGRGQHSMLCLVSCEAYPAGRESSSPVASSPSRRQPAPAPVTLSCANVGCCSAAASAWHGASPLSLPSQSCSAVQQNTFLKRFVFFN